MIGRHHPSRWLLRFSTSLVVVISTILCTTDITIQSVDALQPPKPPQPQPSSASQSKSQSILTTPTPTTPQTISSITLEVCQNKHCCKGNPNVLQTLSNLQLDKCQVKACGCLSQCEQGPNVQVTTTIHKEDAATSSSSTLSSSSALLHNMKDVTSIVCALETHFVTALSNGDDADASEDPILAPPAVELSSIRKAACKVLEKVDHLSNDAQEQERFLTSIINRLHPTASAAVTTRTVPTGTMEAVPNLTVLYHAYAKRAKVYLETGDYAKAVADAKVVTLSSASSSSIITEESLSLAFRVWVDAEQARRNLPNAIQALQQWHQAQPTYRTKIQKELQTLMEQTSSSSPSSLSSFDSNPNLRP